MLCSGFIFYEIWTFVCNILKTGMKTTEATLTSYIYNYFVIDSESNFDYFLLLQISQVYIHVIDNFLRKTIHGPICLKPVTVEFSIEEMTAAQTCN